MTVAPATKTSACLLNGFLGFGSRSRAEGRVIIREEGRGYKPPRPTGHSSRSSSQERAAPVSVTSQVVVVVSC
jgi:hypothetical protein